MADPLRGIVLEHVDGRAWVKIDDCDGGWIASVTSQGPLPSLGSRISVQVELDGDGLPKSVQIVEAGDATDRERYVTERAEFLALAFTRSLAERHGGWTRSPSPGWLSGSTPGPTEVVHRREAFRDLIDKGVLK